MLPIVWGTKNQTQLGRKRKQWLSCRLPLGLSEQPRFLRPFASTCDPMIRPDFHRTRQGSTSSSKSVIYLGEYYEYYAIISDIEYYAIFTLLDPLFFVTHMLNFGPCAMVAFWWKKQQWARAMINRVIPTSKVSNRQSHSIADTAAAENLTRTRQGAGSPQ